MKSTILVAMILCLSACAAGPHPGTANAFDNATYNTLLVTDNVIQTTRADYAASKFPAAIMPQVKTALNDLIAAYDAADVLYCGQPVTGPLGTLQCAPGSYHAMAMAGTATPQQSADITAKINAVNSAITSLASAKAGTK
jgi:hypothetical protein